VSENQRSDDLVVGLEEEEGLGHVPDHRHDSFVRELYQASQDGVAQFVAQFGALTQKEVLNAFLEVDTQIALMFGCARDESYLLRQVLSLLVGERLGVFEELIEFGHKVFVDHLELGLVEVGVFVDTFEQLLEWQLLPLQDVQGSVYRVPQVDVVLRVQRYIVDVFVV